MALLDIVKKGSTSRGLSLYVFDNTTGLPKTGLVYTSTGIALWYRREAAVKTSITPATLAALTTAWSSGGFLEVGDGYYRLDVPDAALATGANFVDVGGTFTGFTVVGGRVRLVDYDPEDTVRLGLTAMPAVASGSAGAIVTSGTGTAQLAVSGGRANADVLYWNAAAVGAPNVAGYPVVDVAKNAGTNVTSAAGRQEVNVSHFGGTAGTFSSGVPSANVATWLGTAPNALVSGRVDTSTGAMAANVLTATAINADALTAAKVASDVGTEIAAAVGALVCETQGSYTLKQIQSILLSEAAGVTSGNTFKTPDGAANRIVGTAASNTRTAVTLTPSA